MEEVKIELDPNTLSESASYTGPRLNHLDEINADWCVSAMAWMKEQKLIDPRSVAIILNRA
jgi:hypothetical protein